MSATNIYEAIIAVRKAVPYVQKERTMQGGGSYKYAGVEEFIRSLRPEMDNHGIVVFPTSSREIGAETVKTSRGGEMFLVKLEVGYTFTHAASGTSTPPVMVVSEATDSGDKAFGKAMTAAYKQALRQTFMVETGETDPDRHPSIHRQSKLAATMCSAFEACETYVDFEKLRERATARRKSGDIDEENWMGVSRAIGDALNRLSPMSNGKAEAATK